MIPTYYEEQEAPRGKRMSLEIEFTNMKLKVRVNEWDE